ncbi:MAG: hypothetical protein BMS9Abin12_1576 [Acidimicrobiia bacterium]|nr:MAG: hypothetical protein BMS9Abin12_1576 [Acidimicrobiia bacterium]
MPDPPTGTVTFLFTDIEGSTNLLQSLGDQYAEVLAAHFEISRAAFSEHGGVEQDTEGDSLFAVFPGAVDAVGAAWQLRAPRVTLPSASDGTWNDVLTEPQLSFLHVDAAPSRYHVVTRPFQTCTTTRGMVVRSTIDINCDTMTESRTTHLAQRQGVGMSVRKSLLWIDAGMALFVAVFVVIVAFIERNVFAPVMTGYMVALVIWAFVAERAVMHTDGHESPISADRNTKTTGTTEPLTH